MPYLLPHEVLTQPLPCPASEDAEIPRNTCVATWHMYEAGYLRLVSVPEKDDIRDVVYYLSGYLFSTYPSRILWPCGFPIYQGVGQASPIVAYFSNSMVIPTLQLFYQLRARSTWSPIGLNSITNAGYHLFMFRMPFMDYRVHYEFDIYPYPSSGPPVVALMTTSQLDGILAPEAASLAILSDLLQYIWGISGYPTSPVLCCDFRRLLILHPSVGWEDTGEIQSECIQVPNLAAIRIVLAAYLVRPLSAMGYLLKVDEVLDYDLGFGPLPEPSCLTLLPDEIIFSTFQHHSDFDYAIISRSLEHAEQFLRWKNYILETMDPQYLTAGDILEAVTHGFVRTNPELLPHYPPTLVPESTWQHVEQSRRACPLGDFRERFMASVSFSVRIVEELTAAKTDPRLCRTYVCELLVADNDYFPDSLPLLCLKLYDDRFYIFEDEEMFSPWQTAEDYLRRELAVYKKLNPVQRSLIPGFYGAHMFRLPDGLQLYGILMEYIEAPNLCKEVVQSFTGDEQLQLIYSLRQAVRVLQYADISQHDWHRGQILLRRFMDNTGSFHVHCILIDFSGCTQSTFPLEKHRDDDFERSMATLVDDGGLSRNTVAKVFGLREVWDDFWTATDKQELRYHRPPDPLFSILGMIPRPMPHLNLDDPSIESLPETHV